MQSENFDPNKHFCKKNFQKVNCKNMGFYLLVPTSNASMVLAKYKVRDKMVHADLERARECATLARECATCQINARKIASALLSALGVLTRSSGHLFFLCGALESKVAHSRAKVAHSRGRSKSAWTIFFLTLYFANTNNLAIL